MTSNPPPWADYSKATWRCKCPTFHSHCIEHKKCKKCGASSPEPKDELHVAFDLGNRDKSCKIWYKYDEEGKPVIVKHELIEPSNSTPQETMEKVRRIQETMCKCLCGEDCKRCQDMNADFPQIAESYKQMFKELCIAKKAMNELDQIHDGIPDKYPSCQKAFNTLRSHDA